MSLPDHSGQQSRLFPLHSLTGAVRLALCALPAFAAAPALAQRVPPAVMPEVKVQATPDDGYAVQTSSSATKTEQLLRDTPQSITVITRDLIQDQAMQSMADAIRYVPGVVTAQGEGNRDTAVFRGNSSTSDFYIDGMRDDVQYYRDFYNIDSMEALKGANAMIFGRGGAGGVINRVTRQPEWRSISAGALTLGAHSNRRATIDAGRAISADAAFRVNAMLEDSGSFRDGVGLERSGINPTFSYRFSADTRATFGVEHVEDRRTADRGIPSYQGRPFDTAPSTYFGRADLSFARAVVGAFNALLEHDFGGGASVRNRTRYADYDKIYQNVFPGAVNAAGTMVTLQGYNNATQRRNLFNQTDLNFSFASGAVQHKVAAGLELGRQRTDNFRNSAYFPTVSASTTTISVPVAAPRTMLPVLFRQSASDADNHGMASVASVYLQDQIEFSPRWQVIAGLRQERFAVDFLNRRSGTAIAQTDAPLAPRAGLLYKPLTALSLYASYSMAYVPRAGEQLSSLTATNRAFKPEQFRNLEVGAKWDLRTGLAFTAALYQLKRRNVVIPDPADAGKSVLVDGQQTRGLELGLAGNVSRDWNIMGGYAWQDATISRTLSASALSGARLAQVPIHSLSLWNRYAFTPLLGAGLGVVYRGAIFASTSNTVELPAFTRVDAALYYRVSPAWRLQLNLENAFNSRYYASANSNDNITPGAPRALRLGLNASF